jgi:hypothetical protein
MEHGFATAKKMWNKRGRELRGLENQCGEIASGK